MIATVKAPMKTILIRRRIRQFDIALSNFLLKSPLRSILGIDAALHHTFQFGSFPARALRPKWPRLTYLLVLLSYSAVMI